MLGLALERLSYNPTYDIATTFFLKDEIEQMEADKDAFEGLSSFLNATCGEAETIMVLKEYPRWIRERKFKKSESRHLKTG